MRHVRHLSTILIASALAAIFLPAIARAGAPAKLYDLTLPDGRTATVFADGRAEIFSQDRRRRELRSFQGGPAFQHVAGGPSLPDKARVSAALMRPPSQPFESGSVIVVFRAGTAPSSDTFSLDPQALTALRAANDAGATPNAPAYTNDVETNRALAAVGTASVERLFRSQTRAQLSTMSGAGLDLANAYRLGVVGSSVRDAVARLGRMPSVLYASPEWHVTPMHTEPVPLPDAEQREAQTRAARVQTERGIPGNFALASSLQSLLNAPSVDAAAAFDEIWSTYHELPGSGEIVTNVSIGDLDDERAADDRHDPCHGLAQAYGPTTTFVGGQRYIDWPSLPLIPTYVADRDGALSGSAETCGNDPFLDEVGLDFSMMAPLPNDAQRAGAKGAGVRDLLGIAPGASYRLVVPAQASYTGIQTALLAAALQSPRPNVITASLGYGFDTQGFSGRYLEDDPLTESVVASIVRTYGVVVCISAGDGIRTYTPTAIGPDGGSTPTDVAPPGSPITSLADVELSGFPSADSDSGAIDVGGTTLDDIFSAPPQDASRGFLQAQHAFPETRYSGFASFSSGDGTRVNVSAPADNVVSFTHRAGHGANEVSIVINGGTSASAPETAAAAAVVLQVARLTGHPFSTATAVRNFLIETASPVPPNGQAAEHLDVGPQIDLRNAVERLMRAGGRPGSPRVRRVAVEQRRDLAQLDQVFVSDTDPSAIDLSGSSRQSWNGASGAPGDGTNADQLAWITIAPDWEWLPAGTRYRLSVAHRAGSVLAVTPWARLLPAQIFAKAGVPIVGTSSRTIVLKYDALQGNAVIASASVPLTFGPAGPKIFAALAPSVSQVVRGNDVAVRYDISQIPARYVHHPRLFVTLPGRFNPGVLGITEQELKQRSIPLDALSGTAHLPAKLFANGGGIYGVAIAYDETAIGLFLDSDVAFIRVQSSASTKRPLPPQLSAAGSAPGHFLEIPYGGSFQVNYDVSGVPGANGAIVEISAPGPGYWGLFNPFNNPEGTARDENGADTGSVAFIPVSGTSGTTTLNAKTAGLVPTFNHTIRVLPTIGGAPAGEASDVSTILEDGVRGTNGGYLGAGFGVNQNGLDGFVTPLVVGSQGGKSSVQTFDQTSMSVVRTDTKHADRYLLGFGYSTLGAGIFGSDTGLFELVDFYQAGRTYGTLGDVAAGSLGPAWNPPFPKSLFLQQAAANQANTTVAVMARDTTLPYPRAWRVFSSDLVTGSFGPAIDLSPAVASFGFPDFFGITLNSATNHAWLFATDDNASTSPTMVVDADLTTGTVSGFRGPSTGIPWASAIDAQTNKAAVATIDDQGLTIYDLAKKTGKEVILPGYWPGDYVASDPVHHLFLVIPDAPPDDVILENWNAQTSLFEYDENGTLVARRGPMSRFAGGFYDPDGMQLNPKLRMGFTYNWDESQLQPFSY